MFCSVMVTRSADLGVFWKMKPSISHSSFRVKGGYSFQSQGSCCVMILPKTSPFPYLCFAPLRCGQWMPILGHNPWWCF